MFNTRIYNLKCKHNHNNKCFLIIIIIIKFYIKKKTYFVKRPRTPPTCDTQKENWNALF